MFDYHVIIQMLILPMVQCLSVNIY